LIEKFEVLAFVDLNQGQNYPVRLTETIIFVTGSIKYEPYETYLHAKMRIVPSMNHFLKFASSKNG